jgi:hypothetical protein
MQHRDQEECLPRLYALYIRLHADPERYLARSSAEIEHFMKLRVSAAKKGK